MPLASSVRLHIGRYWSLPIGGTLPRIPSSPPGSASNLPARRPVRRSSRRFRMARTTSAILSDPRAGSPAPACVENKRKSRTPRRPRCLPETCRSVSAVTHRSAALSARCRAPALPCVLCEARPPLLVVSVPTFASLPRPGVMARTACTWQGRRRLVLPPPSRTRCVHLHARSAVRRRRRAFGLIAGSECRLQPCVARALRCH
jgi:hypothetical protein